MDNSLLFATLFRKYLDNRCSPDEVDQLMAFLKDDAFKQHANELIGMQAAAQMDDHRPVDRALKERLEQRLQAILESEADAIPMHRHRFVRRNRWWMAAAAVMLLLGAGIGAYVWLSRSPKPALALVKPQSHVKNAVQDVPPGGNKAKLILSDGSTIILDNAANGTLAQQGNARIVKLNDGQLLYNQTAQNAGKSFTIDHSPLAYNTLATPRGGQYQLVLPDGSKVWLNSASSIRYPTTFTGSERSVEITGEAYFEVTKAPSNSPGGGEKGSMPFKVKISSVSGEEKGEITVLGTHFNVNAYDDEVAVKATLLEGSVKVTKDVASAILKPGEQASIRRPEPVEGSHSSHTIPVQTADVEEVMAWKNGAFQFAGADIQSVMRQISRWYDVEVEYKGNISLHFAGTMSRNLNISQVLQILEKAAGLKTSVTGRKITVMP